MIRKAARSAPLIIALRMKQSTGDCFRISPSEASQVRCQSGETSFSFRLDHRHCNSSFVICFTTTDRISTFLDPEDKRRYLTEEER